MQWMRRCLVWFVEFYCSPGFRLLREPERTIEISPANSHLANPFRFPEI